MKRSHLQRIVAKALSIDSDAVDEHSSQESLPNWDSLAHLEILQGIEALSPGSLSEIPGLVDATSFEELLDLLHVED